MRTTAVVLAILLTITALALVGGLGKELDVMHSARGKASAQAASRQGPYYSRSGYDITPLPRAEVEALAAKLTDEQRRVTQASGTEAAFCGGYLDNKDKGIYTCVVCGLPLFQSNAKFESGTGWPSFYQPFDPEHVASFEDHSHGMVRTEIRCARCAAHLGHVFDDGPKPTGLRYCLNSASLSFAAAEHPLPAASLPVAVETAYFAAGCFWGVEDAFQRYPGVLDAVSGYMGGSMASPSYEQVCTEDTGHAETVRVRFDPRRVKYSDLLRFFFKIHDPTTLNRQGPDVGSQYRSAIFAENDAQKQEAEAILAELNRTRPAGSRPLVTQLSLGGTFWPAEEYHQDYNAKHGRACHPGVEAHLPPPTSP